MIFGLMALAATAASAGKDVQKPRYQVSVYLLNQQIVELQLLGRAKALASSLFAGIDIRLRWEVGEPPRRAKAGRDSRPDAEIVINLVTDTSASFHPGAPAYSSPYAQSGVRVTVLYDRVQDAPATMRSWALLSWATFWRTKSRTCCRVSHATPKRV